MACRETKSSTPYKAVVSVRPAASEILFNLFIGSWADDDDAVEWIVFCIGQYAYPPLCWSADGRAEVGHVTTKTWVPLASATHGRLASFAACGNTMYALTFAIPQDGEEEKEEEGDSDEKSTSPATGGMWRIWEKPISATRTSQYHPTQYQDEKWSALDMVFLKGFKNAPVTDIISLEKRPSTRTLPEKLSSAHPPPEKPKPMSALVEPTDAEHVLGAVVRSFDKLVVWMSEQPWKFTSVDLIPSDRPLATSRSLILVAGSEQDDKDADSDTFLASINDVFSSSSEPRELWQPVVGLRLNGPHRLYTTLMSIREEEGEGEGMLLCVECDGQDQEVPLVVAWISASSAVGSERGEKEKPRLVGHVMRKVLPEDCTPTGFAFDEFHRRFIVFDEQDLAWAFPLSALLPDTHLDSLLTCAFQIITRTNSSVPERRTSSDAYPETTSDIPHHVDSSPL